MTSRSFQHISVAEMPDIDLESPPKHGPLGEFETTVAMFAKLREEIRNLSQDINKDQIIVDDYSVAGNGTVFPVIRQYNGPIIITAILAIFGTLSTSVTLQIGNRLWNLPSAAGSFNPQGLSMQLQRDDQVTLTVAPSQASAFVEIFGYADRRIRDRSQ